MITADRMIAGIGRNVRQIRKKNGMSLPKLAVKAKVPKSLLSKLENGPNQNPTIKTLYRISRALDIHITQLWFE